MLLNNNQTYFIGIDGGGSKTLSILGDASGKLHVIQYAESSNMKSKPWDRVRQLLSDLIDRTLIKGNIEASELNTIYLGLAGSERMEDKQRVYEALSLLYPKSRIIVQNDAIPALAAGTWGEAGIILIAGTGSIACFYDPHSQQYQRVGGWGYVLGDEGSGFDLGKRAVIQVLREFDGRGEPTILTHLILDKLGLQSPYELITYFYENREMRREMASLSTVVFAAAQQQDRIAELIIEQALADLCELIVPLFKEIEPKRKLPILLSGGIFLNEPFMEQFSRKVKASFPADSISRVNLPAVIGAYILSLQDTDIAITDELKNRIEAEWKALQNQLKVGE